MCALNLLLWSKVVEYIFVSGDQNNNKITNIYLG